MEQAQRIVEDMEHWVLCRVHGTTYLGKLHGRSSGKETFDLSPVYEVNIMQGTGPQGYISKAEVVLPFAMTSITKLTLPDDAVCVKLNDLAKNEREGLFAQAMHIGKMAEDVRSGELRTKSIDELARDAMNNRPRIVIPGKG